MTQADIAQRARFDRIRYAQVWEDAEVLLAGLAVPPGETILTVASAGDNALALLLADPAKVVAIDLSEAQLDCLRLRIAAYRTLDHPALLELMGSRPSTRRRALLTAACADLAPADRARWQERADAVEAYGLGGIGRFEGYFRTFRRHVLPLVHRRRTIDALLRPRSAPDRERFYAQRWNTVTWRLLTRMFFSRLVMGRLGRDPAFFAHAGGSVAAHVARRARHALVALEPAANPYLHWILTGRHGDVLPVALQEPHFEVIRSRLDRLELRRVPVEAVAEQGERFGAFNLSDVFEYMGPEAFAETYRLLLSIARPGARLVYWNMMAPRRAPPPLADRIRRDVEAERRLYGADRAFFYSDLVIEEVLP